MTQEDLNAYLNAQRTVQMAQSSFPPTKVTAKNNGRRRKAKFSGVSDENRVSKIEARQMEQRAIQRFNQKVRAIDVLRHPVSKELIPVQDWGALYEEFEDREALMEAMKTAFLDRETLATTPHNSRARYVLSGKPGLILELRFVAHLDQFCQAGSDERPIDRDELRQVLQELESLHLENDALYIVGLASPTGWSVDAIEYIQGSGKDRYDHPHVHVLLLDLRANRLYYNEQDAAVAGFAELFRLTTEEKDITVLEDRLRGEVSDQNGVILRSFAQAVGVDEELALLAARNLAAQDEERYRLVRDRGVGWIIVAV